MLGRQRTAAIPFICSGMGRPYLKVIAKKTFSRNIVEGLNYKIKLTLREAYGYRTPQVAEIALYHTLAQLPEPELTHEFF